MAAVLDNLLVVCVGVVLSAVAGVHCYEWGSHTCNGLSESKTDVRGSGCVAEGSVPSLDLDCRPCVFDYQCDSDWCVPEWKLCYSSGFSCHTHHTAECSDCPSGASVDLDKCKCKNKDFPNNWVQCTNGSGGYDTYSAVSTGGYKRQEYSDGSLKEKDEFAVNAVCYHNKYRQEAAGLDPVSWNKYLAAFATRWLNYLKLNKNCAMTHSSGGNRSNIGPFGYSGENLYMSWNSGGHDHNKLPFYGRWAAEAWYGEMKYWSYGGPEDGFNRCPYRNNDGGAQIGHISQMLWDSTTDIGCDYVTCDNNLLVSCVYGPGGNMQGSPAFDQYTYCNLKQWHGNKDYGGFPNCYNGYLGC